MPLTGQAPTLPVPCRSRARHQPHPAAGRVLTACLFLIALLMVPFQASSAEATQGRQPVVLDEKISEASLGRHLQWLEDPTGTMSYDEASASDSAQRFRHSDSDVPGFGFNASAYWLKIPVIHDTPNDQVWLLDVGYAPLQYIDVYWTVPGSANNGVALIRHLRGGSSIPVGKRPFHHRTHVFPIQLHGLDSTTIYLRVAGESSKTLPLTIWRPEEFAQAKSAEFYLLGAYVGIMLSLMAYNLFVFVAVREMTYALYAGFVFGMMTLFVSFGGFGQLYFWPWSTDMAIRMTPASMCLAYVFGGLFTLWFLNSKELSPRFYRAIAFFIVACAVLFTLSWHANYHFIIIASLVTSGLGVIAILMLSVHAARKRHPNSLFYLLAWSSLLLSMLVAVLRVFSIIPSTLLTEYSVFIGSALEGILLSMALAGRMRLMKTEKEQARQQALDHQKIAFETIANYTRKLEAEFDRRSRELLSAQQEVVSRQKMAALGVMTAGVAHEINNPNNFISAGVQNAGAALTSLQSFVNELLEADSDPDIRKAFDAYFSRIHSQNQLIEEGSKRIERIVAGLGTITQYERADVNTVVVTEGLVETTRLLKGKFPGIDFRLDLDFTPVMLCHAGELNQAYMNILINAAQAIEHRPANVAEVHSGLITVASHPVDTAEGAGIRISISDNGCGMSEETRDSAFDPFFTTREVGSGSGLGLSIARDTIIKHKGSIQIDSTPGVGTTVEIVLPLVA